MATDDDDILDKVMPNDPETPASDDIEILIAEDAADDSSIPGEGKEHDEGKAAPDRGGRVEGAEDLAAEDRNLSKNVQDRIRREVRLRKREVESERNMRLAAEAAAAQATTDKLDAQVITYTVLTKGIEEKITAITEQLVKAKESGQTKEEVTLQSQLTEQQANLREANSALARVEQEKKTPKVVVNQEANKWVANNKWFSDAEFDVEAAGVRAIDRRLTASKRFDPRSPEFFAELNRQIVERFPTLRKRATDAGLLNADDDERPQPRKQTRDPVSGVRTRQDNRAPNESIRSRSSVTLGKSDFENMRRFKMDPNNKAHLQAYAREKMAQQEE